MLDFTQHELPTVLLIDDDMVSREVMATMLTMSGYPVHTAADGSTALDVLGGGECVPGVILMDAQMPGLSGTQLIEKLRARSLARLYLISASGPSEDMAAAADGFLQKPFDPESLTRLIEEQAAPKRPPAAKGLDPEEQVINPNTLAQLREMMPEAAVKQIYEAIVSDVRKRTAALEKAVVNADWVETRRIGHTIKGGGSMAGATQIARLGQIVEAGGLEPSSVNQVDNSLTIIRDLRDAAANLQRMLEGEFKA